MAEDRPNEGRYHPAPNAASPEDARTDPREKINESWSQEIHPLDDRELANLINTELFDAQATYGTELGERRRENLAYYHARPFGNEQIGRSQVILSDVADTVEWIKPSLIRMFFGGDQVVRFKPNKEGQEEQAQQATDYINHVFMHQQEGFRTGYDWMTTALIESNSVVKAYYEELEFPEVTELKEITEIELQAILADQDGDVEVMSVTAREGTLPVMDPQTGQVVDAPTIDAVVRRIELQRRIRVVAIPPEEFLIARREIRLNDDTVFTCHRTRVTLSKVISMGIDPELALEIPSDDSFEYEIERVERFADDSVYPQVNSNARSDAVSRNVWLNDCWVRADYDGDGYTELRNVLTAGNESSLILLNDYATHNPFSDLCAVPLAHKFYGLSVADLVKDLQLIRSTLLRQMLDNVYLTNNGRYKVMEGAVEIDDLLNSLPGGIVRCTHPDAVVPLETPILGPQAFQMLEYLEGVKEQRTGITRYNQGLDAQSLNKTAFGVGAIMEAANARLEMIARMFAIGFERLFRIVLRLMIESPIKDQVVKLRGKWVTVDPSTWDPEWGIEIETGLGIGQAQQRIQQLLQIAEVQNGLVNAGMGGIIVEPEQAYNLAHEIQMAMGFRNENYFFKDPGDKQPEPQPDADMEKVKLDAEKMKAEQALKAKELEIDSLRIAQDGEIKRYQADLTAELERERIESAERIAAMRIESDIERAQIQAAATTEKAQATNGHDQEATT